MHLCVRPKQRELATGQETHRKQRAPFGADLTCLFLDEAISCKTRRVGPVCQEFDSLRAEARSQLLRKTTVGVTFQSRHGTQQLSSKLSSNGSCLNSKWVPFHFLFPPWLPLRWHWVAAFPSLKLQTPEPPKTTSEMCQTMFVAALLLEFV